MLFQLLFLALSIVLIIIALKSYKPESPILKRIHVLKTDTFPNISAPQLIAQNLNNPISPILLNNDVVFSESATGNVKKISANKSEITTLIKGFGKDNFAGYDISAQGITIDPVTNLWIVCAAEDDGHVSIFDPNTFPTEAQTGIKVILENAVEDNPFSAVLVNVDKISDGEQILVVSSGTAKSYQGSFNRGNPSPLTPSFEVESGLIGMAVDPSSNWVFGAVYGSSNDDGSIISWDATKEPISPKTVASGFTNLVDVAFTSDGILLALNLAVLELKVKVYCQL